MMSHFVCKRAKLSLQSDIDLDPGHGESEIAVVLLYFT